MQHVQKMGINSPAAQVKPSTPQVVKNSAVTPSTERQKNVQQQQQRQSTIKTTTQSGGSKREAEEGQPVQMKKRIKPMLVSSTVSKPTAPFQEDKDPLAYELLHEEPITYLNPVISNQAFTITKTEGGVAASAVEPSDRPGSSASSDQASNHPKTPINEAFAELIKACRDADSTNSMQQLINKRLIKYYHGAHPDFVNSRVFCKNVRATTERIRDDPKMVCYLLRDIVDELNVRRKTYSATVEGAEEEEQTTGDPKLDKKLRKLSLALAKCEKKIKELEEAEVNFDEEQNTAYLQAERFKDRACKLYEKICDLTGENKNANRVVRRPIKFKETNFKQFNNTVQNWCNRTHEFPDFADVFRMLEHCNTQYAYELNQESMKRIAQNAFLSLGRLLSNRRRLDLYETAEYFSKQRDPALDDPVLLAKLEKNKQAGRKVDEVINQ